MFCGEIFTVVKTYCETLKFGVLSQSSKFEGVLYPSNRTNLPRFHNIMFVPNLDQFMQFEGYNTTSNLLGCHKTPDLSVS